MKNTLFILLLITAFGLTSWGQNKLPYLRKQGSATQLMINDKPFLVLGGELGNSSASCSSDIERIFPKLQQMGLNTVLVPAYWDMIEPIEGQFDFSLIEQTIQQARKHQLKVIFLWFGAWKNSMSCYAPLWFKKDYKKYPRAYTKAGKPLEIASVFSPNVLQADRKAFSELMTYIASVDQDGQTVIMIQIENEIGMLEDARDHSKIANTLFNAEVPEALMNYLTKNKKKLHPQLEAKWGQNGFQTKGSWKTIFGDDVYTDELFMAWHYAQYVDVLAQSARSIHPLPLFVNAAMNSRNRLPGQYPSAGPLAHLIDIWQCGAPHIDFLAPDIYDKGFTDWVAQYHLPNNPLFLPEVRLGSNNGAQAFYVFGEHDAIGFSPFSIEDGSDSPSSPGVQAYRKLNELMPIIGKHQGKGAMNGLLFNEESPERILFFDDLKLTCRHFFTLPWDARATDGSPWPEVGGLVIRLNNAEYLIAGNGIVVEFDQKAEIKSNSGISLGEDGFVSQGGNGIREQEWRGGLRVGIGTVDEISFDDNGEFVPIRRLNGDQTHQGRHVRIGVDQFSILHIQLYEYQ